MMHVKKGQKVRMVWKTFFCGGNNQGVVTEVRPSDQRIMVKMNNGDYVIHNTVRTDLCDVVYEENWPSYCVELGTLMRKQRESK
jgi:hypothetical protein